MRRLQEDLDLAIALSLSEAMSSKALPAAAAEEKTQSRLGQEEADMQFARELAAAEKGVACLRFSEAQNPFIAMPLASFQGYGRQLNKLSQQIGQAAADSNVHGISVPCGGVLEQLHAMLMTQPGFVDGDLHATACDALKRMSLGGDVPGMKALVPAVTQRQVIKEGSHVMGRMDLLLGLIVKLSGHSEDEIASLRAVLADNKRLGGGCLQGIFNRFTYILLLPRAKELLSDAFEQKLMSPQMVPSP